MTLGSGTGSVTVKQSLQPSSVKVNINKTLSVAGTAEDLIVIGGEQAIEVVRDFELVVDKDCYVEIGDTATTDSILLKAGDCFWKDNVWIKAARGSTTTKISFLNAVLGETPNIRGVVWGY